MPMQPSLVNQIAALPDKRQGQLWAGPCGEGPLGGITQSMLGRWLVCRERFRVQYIIGLQPVQRWKSTWGFGNMWHVCEEAHAANKPHEQALTTHAQKDCHNYPLDREEIEKWYNICRVQFPEYVKHWSAHPDVIGRTPLMQEQTFDVPYALPSGRTVRLRGKFDSVDLIDGGVWLQENKTKSEIDQLAIERQLRFDLQTMLYLIALQKLPWDHNLRRKMESVLPRPWDDVRVAGVRYNVVRRDCPIRKHKEKCTKPRYGTGRNAGKLLDPGKITPAETDEHFYGRLLDDYIRAEPSQWFMRVKAEVSARDIKIFKETCLDPVLEQLCSWYDEVTGQFNDGDHDEPPLNYRMPYGVYNPLTEGGATEYDAYLETGSAAGMNETKMFTELV